MTKDQFLHYLSLSSETDKLILDRNLYSLDVFYVLFVAKSCGVPVVPGIILENVEIRHT